MDADVLKKHSAEEMH